MRRSPKRRLGAVLALGATAAVTLASDVNAEQVFRESVHEERAFVAQDFCDVPDLTVEVAFVMDLRLHAVPHGRDRLDYFLQHGIRTEALTNSATGKSLTSVAKVIEKDMRIADNGDGTLTILILATGNAVLYGENGHAIARNPGQIRLEILVDHGGTPKRSVRRRVSRRPRNGEGLDRPKRRFLRSRGARTELI